MFEDFGWSGDEMFLGDCQDDYLALGYAMYQGTKDLLAELDAPDSEPLDEEDEEDWEADDCPLDGDAESALASCGWGTDEDYGYYGDDGGW